LAVQAIKAVPDVVWEVLQDEWLRAQCLGRLGVRGDAPHHTRDGKILLAESFDLIDNPGGDDSPAAARRPEGRLLRAQLIK
jgi:hypothetical protein